MSSLLSVAARTTVGVMSSSPSPVRTTRQCPENSLPCRNSTSCYRRLWACDGIRDCPLADDELGCYQNSNRTMEKETSDGSSGGGGNPYSLELGFLIFVMAGGLLFLLFLWWLCNISVHRRGHRGVSCMEALVADFKDRTWKSDLYDPDDFSEDTRGRDRDRGGGIRHGRGEAAAAAAASLTEEGHPHHHHNHHHHHPRHPQHQHRHHYQQTGSLFYNPRRSSSSRSSSSSSRSSFSNRRNEPSNRCFDPAQDDLWSVDEEVGFFGSSVHRQQSYRPLPVLHLSRPPSYNSCLNASAGGGGGSGGGGGGAGGGGGQNTAAPPIIISPVRRSCNVIGDEDDVTEGGGGGGGGDVKPVRPVLKAAETEEEEGEENGSRDLLPSYDEVTRQGAEFGGAGPERLPKYPPAYQEVVESE